MHRNNTKSKAGFALSLIYWSLIIWICYKSLLFRSLPGHSLTESYWILICLISFSLVSGFLIEKRSQRNGVSVFFDVIWGYGIYTALAYFPLKRTSIMIALIISTTFSVTYCLFTFCRKIHNHNIFHRILRRRMIQSVYGSKRLTGLVFLCLTIFIGANAIFGNALFSPSVSAAKATYDSNAFWAQIESLEVLKQDTWKSLSLKEKMNVLQTVANINQALLGLPHELNVGTQNMDIYKCGFYSDATHSILISVDDILTSSSRDLINTIAHESYHALQRRMVDEYDNAKEESRNLPMYDAARQYKKEFAQYADGEEDYEKYYFQECEIDARRYAETFVNAVFEQIDDVTYDFE